MDEKKLEKNEEIDVKRLSPFELHRMIMNATYQYCDLSSYDIEELTKMIEQYRSNGWKRDGVVQVCYPGNFPVYHQIMEKINYPNNDEEVDEV